MTAQICKCNILFEKKSAHRDAQKKYREIAAGVASGVCESVCSANIRNACFDKGARGFEVNIMFTNEERMREINSEYRNIDRFTDVLSFPINDFAYGEGEVLPYNISEDTNRLMLGDIIVCVPVMLRQAEEYGHSASRECAFLICHGMLHLMGYDHMNEEDEKQMFGFADMILNELEYTRDMEE